MRGWLTAPAPAAQAAGSLRNWLWHVCSGTPGIPALPGPDVGHQCRRHRCRAGALRRR
ncbi:hypothetical protein XHV734_4603 [Xanthomonas hortorum pv. vitians]|nr:hypothetical protein XHV734_4603 [Xanthomonas hortorum pv. vitians]